MSFGMGGGFWTDERSDRAQAMWADGSTASEIASELGCTRNAVLSRVNRKGWKSPNSNGAHNANNRRAQAARAQRRVERTVARRAVRTAVAAPSVVPGEPVEALDEAATRSFSASGPVYSLFALTADHCRWPIGTPGKPDFCFCAAPKMNPKVPYCAPHVALAEAPPVRHRNTTPRTIPWQRKQA